MLACMRTAAVYGIEAYPIQVEVDVSFGLPSFTMVGLPDAGIRESRDRIRSAIRNSGFEFPPHRITVNLSPADVRKEGASFDLPIALGVLAASGLLVRRDVDDLLLVGALSLDGAIQPTRGVLPVASAARRDGYRGLLLPEDNQREAAAVQGLDLYGVRNLPEAVRALNDPRSFDRPVRVTIEGGPPAAAVADFADVHGQLLARRALEIAAAGGHNALLVGPPGAGKTMMARRLAGILPPLTQDEAVEVTTVHSVAGLIPAGAGLLTTRPFRAPHHTVSDVALVGGGTIPRPGEISLAHHGVLFLDEMPEFSRHVLEVLRQPLEEGAVRIARAARTATFPAAFMLVGAMNPCPCGYAGSDLRPCRCTPQQVERYTSRLSGPLRDRIDLAVSVTAVPPRDLHGDAGGVGSAAIRERVVGARCRQLARDATLNARLEGRRLRARVRLDAPSRTLLEKAVSRLTLSARAFDRVLRVGRTIAESRRGGRGHRRAPCRGAAVQRESVESGVLSRQKLSRSAQRELRG